MNLSQLLQWNVILFVLIFARWAGLVMLAPVFGARGVPGAVRLGITASLTSIMYPIVASTQPVLPDQLLPYVGILIKEILVGLMIGFLTYTISAIIEGAGQLIDFQMGFMMGNSLDPIYGSQSPLMGNFHIVLATMILLVTNAHHYLIAAMVKRYEYIPLNPDALQMSPRFFGQIIAEVFALSVQLALPVLGAILLADIGVGLLARAVPQLNIFAVVFAIKIIFGLILLLLALPWFGETVNYLFNGVMDWVLQLYRGWGN